ncbi:transcriptional regulator [Pilimelia terevasa]|uniref:Transcriptional regulator n=1 Tax=Pilimelia terevasa TaxID=53372 RepID=A0A8J3BPC2_9ACTN|nr:helix-turn-helix transcriptional regulator [Pilimelia terevasa]GGK37889.1 transcriptional regulator [Pilimelia terevasa]
MTDAHGSTLLRRHIGRRFEALRRRAGLTQVQAAEALERGRATLGRIEDGDERVRFRSTDVKAMLDLYQAGDEERELLLGMTAETRNGRHKSWWHDYTETELPNWFGLYVSLEDGAETIRQFEAELVPGLLQTRAYAAELTRIPDGYLDDQERERRVTVRMARQSVLTRPRAPRLDTILSEAVLRRQVGGPDGMADQLALLVESTRQANISVRVVPFAAGVHGGMAAVAPFTILDFPLDHLSGGPIEPPLAYAESLTGALYLTHPEEVLAYRGVWSNLEGRALDEASSRDMITTIWKEHTRG